MAVILYRLVRMLKKHSWHFADQFPFQFENKRHKPKGSIKTPSFWDQKNQASIVMIKSGEVAGWRSAATIIA